MAAVASENKARLQRRVAIKTCRSQDLEVRQRFEHEATLTASLDHRNLVATYDYAEEGELVYEVGEGLMIMVPGDSIINLTGATLDLPSNPMQGGLVIRNPNRPNPLDGQEVELTGTPAEKLQQLLDKHINPSLAAHGGYAELVKMEDTVAHILMGGGCQGCAMSAATLRQGIEVMIAEAIPEITEIVDVTDHEAGENPFFE